MAEYIDRIAALSFPFANGEYDHEHANEHFIYGCETYKEWVEGLPIADVAPVVHAHWENEDLVQNNMVIGIVGKCSNCGKARLIDNYCPNCGAKMDEEN